MSCRLYVSRNRSSILACLLQNFDVSAAYLSQWSEYFRAYFAANMKEQTDGVYPINVRFIVPWSISANHIRSSPVKSCDHFRTSPYRQRTLRNCSQSSIPHLKWITLYILIISGFTGVIVTLVVWLSGSFYFALSLTGQSHERVCGMKGRIHHHDSPNL